jgi:DNA-binding transcriptional regulator YhcF (GntR family)
LKDLPSSAGNRLPDNPNSSTLEHPLTISFLVIDAESSTPPFEQVRTQVIEAVRSGALAPGTRLPTVRALAKQLGLAANTVARAYRELEAAAVIETRGRNGSFIAATGDANHRQARDAAIAYVDGIRRLGLPPEEAIALVREALSR